MEDKLELRMPEKEELDTLKEKCQLSPEEERYWNKLVAQRDALYGSQEYHFYIDFYKQKFNTVKDQFGERIGLKRRLCSFIGHAYEWTGTKTMDGQDPNERYPLFEHAVSWYQAADDYVGYFTDYALRQSEACAGAAYYRKKAGLDDEKTAWYARRRDQLLSAFFGDREVIIINTATYNEIIKKNLPKRSVN